MSKNQVFLSYAVEDLLSARQVYLGLRARGLEVWFDKENMTPGRWKEQIEDAIATSRYMILCLSQVALRKLTAGKGFQKNELRLAYDFASAQAGINLSIIPLRLEECGRPEDHRLSIHQQYDLFLDQERTLDRLAVAMGGLSLCDPDPLEQKHETEKFIKELLDTAKSAAYAKDFDKAIAIYSVIIDTDLERPAFLLNNKSNMLSELGRKAEALEAIDEAIHLQPKFVPFYVTRANLRKSLGMRQEALADCCEAIEKWEVFKNKYGDRVGGGNLLLAVAYNARAGVYYEAGEIRAALSDLDESLGIHPELLVSIYQRGCVWLAIGEVEKAIGDFQAAISLHPGYADAYFQRARAWLSSGSAEPEQLSGQYARALEDLNKAVSIDPEHFDSHYLLSVIHCGFGNKEAAIQHALFLIRSRPTEYVPRLSAQSIFQILREDEAFISALKEAESILKQHVGSTPNAAPAPDGYAAPIRAT